MDTVEVRLRFKKNDPVVVDDKLAKWLDRNGTYDRTLFFLSSLKFSNGVDAAALKVEYLEVEVVEP